ncbi:DNA mismatch endonuclease Vsr [Fulvivirga sp. M361]|uniref:very short patch repair endonuclease n=1 Tax=Fulvivirga sp. M361 TaxID=2594266 RepID=UPI00117AD880|nr:very short patch repair endonuclease [Fulvivirga sp. M361]TRX45781.1 DNA mismatch endonuclease Vsr [Fulvivirga sp. M361]
MADTFTKEERSQIMKKVKSSKNKSTEFKLIELFKYYGIKGWRRNFKLFGKPDFVFPKLRIVVFADGCFWHGHNCRNLKPEQNKEYWEQKIKRNIKRDQLVTEKLTTKNWTVLRFWECQIRKGKIEELVNCVRTKV